jgi:hypothetical protein
VVYDPPHQGWAAVHHGDEANCTTLIKASLQRWGVKRMGDSTKILKLLAV